MQFSPRCLLFAFLALSSAPTARALDEIVFEDLFSRRLNERGMTLVDWEGQMANPLITIFVRPPSDATFPATATVTSTQPRLYFELPSQATATGPSKSLSFPSTAPAALRVSIFPDRDTGDELHTLTVTFTAAGGAQRTQQLAVRVVDQDTAADSALAMTVDFSRDTTGFFSVPARRDIVRQAAEDWAYFFADMSLDLVAAGAEETFIWDATGFFTGMHITNAAAYRGFLLYAYGIDQAKPPFRSGGEPSFTGGFQSSGGAPLPLKRSGGTEIEIKGNFNTLGWYLATGDDDWWIASNFGHEQNDLYSIAHHEIGHALIFNPSHTLFGAFKAAGEIDDPGVLAYMGDPVPVNSFDHLDGTLDRLSRKGVFGYEYFGDVPRRRWLITKLDLLVAQAIGYTLRPTSAFVPLDITTTALPRGGAGGFYARTVRAQGGVPSYRWSVVDGTLPPGLALDSFTGEISGIPSAIGTYAFTIELADHDEETAPVSRALSLRIEATPFGLSSIVRSGADVLVSFTTLTGALYRVEYSSTLAAASWTVLADHVPGAGGIVTVTDPGASAVPRRFYRVTEL
jgi:hypothetical protein